MLFFKVLINVSATADFYSLAFEYIQMSLSLNDFLLCSIHILFGFVFELSKIF